MRKMLIPLRMALLAVLTLSMGTAALPQQASAAGVDLRINGQNGTISVPVGSTVTLSWSSSGVARCDTGTSVAPWGPYKRLPASGSQTVTATKTMTFGIQCARTPTSSMIVQDTVAVVVTSAPPPPSSPSFSPSPVPSPSLRSRAELLFRRRKW